MPYRVSWGLFSSRGGGVNICWILIFHVLPDIQEARGEFFQILSLITAIASGLLGYISWGGMKRRLA